jgi:FixJ family two-component response regulator
MANLLLIDDDPDPLAEKVRHLFPAPEHRVEVAYTGSKDLKCIGAVPPDIILLDLRLPDQSGLNVLKQIRAVDARIPVVFVTVARSVESTIEAMRQGAYDYLFKPLDLQKLDRVIGEALKVARLMREPAVVADLEAQERLRDWLRSWISPGFMRGGQMFPPARQESYHVPDPARVAQGIRANRAGVGAARGPAHAWRHRGCVSTRRCRTHPAPHAIWHRGAGGKPQAAGTTEILHLCSGVHP